jgi:hypothetical protein
MSPKFISTDRIYQSLHDAGIINVDPSNVRRCVIDLQAGEAAKVYVETFADDALITFALKGGFTPVFSDGTPR